jgi:hypothetical protein
VRAAISAGRGVAPWRRTDRRHRGSSPGTTPK